MLRKALLVASCAGLLAACGADNKKASGSGAEPVRVPPIRVGQPEAAAGTPGAVVIRFWSRLRDGMYPLALNAFDPDVVDRVGRESFVGALNVARDTALAFAPTIVRTEQVKARQAGTGRRPSAPKELAIVYVEARGAQGATTRSSFLLSHTGFGWSILYDTMLDSALRTFVATARTASPVPSERLAPNPAAQVGAQVARQYQSVANELIGTSF